MQLSPINKNETMINKLENLIGVHFRLLGVVLLAALTNRCKWWRWSRFWRWRNLRCEYHIRSTAEERMQQREWDLIRYERWKALDKRKNPHLYPEYKYEPPPKIESNLAVQNYKHYELMQIPTEKQFVDPVHGGKLYLIGLTCWLPNYYVEPDGTIKPGVDIDHYVAKTLKLDGWQFGTAKLWDGYKNTDYLTKSNKSQNSEND